MCKKIDSVKEKRSTKDAIKTERMEQMKELEKTYNPADIEDRLYRKWEDKKYFHAEVDRSKKPFTIVMPPPNVTGQLHMGHALDNTMQDILIRFKRMQGYSALWQPGTDHAAIATEVKVTEKLKAEGIDKKEIGREAFLQHAWKWKEEYGGRIVNQLKKLGSSADWDRERFTMDEGCSEAVKEVFVNLYEKGYIYKGSRIINWCPVCKTSISDAEVEHVEQEGHFWHINYPIVGEEGRYVEIATTRPETLLGDTAVAVNPKDERYKDIIGKMLKLPLTDREIPVIADEYVDMEFGTGCVKITPAHDPNDFEVGKRHNLEEINILNDDATINEKGGKYAGMDRYEARKAMVADLEKEGLLVKVVPHTHNVGTHDRCKTTVEPMIKPQWFVRMKEMGQAALDLIKTDELEFVPEQFDKTYIHWLENIRDWCISRQLWWGHRIPAWYCDDCGEVMVAKDAPEKCCKCGSTHIHQDEDTLDTWFSSALWPFSTLGWPDKTPELEYFYPTSTLVTGYDIIFFWVARMIFSACENMGSAPFKTVFMHGIVRDENGIKMSKSLGNGIDPLEVIDKYGADALRFFLATGNTPGNDMRYSDKRVEACANFANKLWNASRYVHMNIDDHDVKNELPKTLTTEDKWIVSTLNTVAKEVNENLEKFELGIAVQKIYEFIWDCYCDWYIELVKTRLSSDGEDAQNARQVLLYVLDQILRLLHPFMPYITEEIWQTIPHEGETVMLAKYPEYNAELDYPEASDEMKKIMAAIRAIRNRRAEMNVPPSRKAKVYVATKFADTFKDGTQFIQKLASASEVEVAESFEIEGAVNIVTADAKIYIPMDELVDREKELARLNKELEQVKKRLAQSEGKLNNQGFVAKAPEAVIEKVKGQAAKEREQIALIEAAIAALK